MKGFRGRRENKLKNDSTREQRKKNATIDFVKKCCCQQPLAIWCNTQEMTKNILDPKDDAYETLVFIYNKEVNALM